MIGKTAFKTFALTAALVVAAGTAAAEPNPVLVFTGTEFYTAQGQNFVRYQYKVANLDQYPAAMFAASPTLPPCGNNTSSSRSWVDFFDQRGRRLYGFCALGNPTNLNGIYFFMPEGQIPPSYVYIEINDRQTNTKYRSNLADTVM